MICHHMYLQERSETCYLPTERLPELSEIVHPVITGSDMARLGEVNLVSLFRESC